MAQEFRKREDEEELIRRFEDTLKRKTAEFFDLEAYETIIYYYLDRSKHKKAQVAVEMAMEQYPYSTELISVKAQILSNLQQYDEALELLEEALNLHPTDLDILLSMGSIFSLQGKHENAIELYEQALAMTETDRDELYYSLGLAYQSKEDFDKAI
ncbi:MAG: tetratricopeptide repeat protein, partial [Cyclobacteriaceae bacterium]|nr:tetratricopeptide repeat protein [Cyclobacteriaceae bacterium]